MSPTYQRIIHIDLPLPVRTLPDVQIKIDDLLTAVGVAYHNMRASTRIVRHQGLTEMSAMLADDQNQCSCGMRCGLS